MSSSLADGAWPWGKLSRCGPRGKDAHSRLAALPPCLACKGSLLATANDYLARRDAEWMGPVYRLLGLSVGIIQTEMQRDERRRAYAADITYGTMKEFGFDFLRDHSMGKRQRDAELWLVIVPSRR